MNTTGKLSIEVPDEKVIKMDQDHFPHSWTQDQWARLNPDQHKLYTWKYADELVGFALFGTVPGDDTAHLFKILVVPDRRSDGTAGLFWSAILHELRKSGAQSVYLEVESSNLPAIRFYEKNGFKLLRRNKAYYSNGEDALMMSLTL